MRFLSPATVMVMVMVMAIATLATTQLAKAEESPQSSRSVSVLAEVVSLKKGDAAELLIRQAKEPQDIALRDETDRLIADGSARLQDCVFVRLDHEARALLTSVEELISGTEGDPPEIPNEVIVKGKVEGKISATPSTYTAFEVRNIGISWEILARIVNPDPKGKAAGKAVIQIERTLEWVNLLLREYPVSGPNVPKDNPMAAKWQPRFHSAALSNQQNLPDGQPTFVGTLEEAGMPDRVLFVFLTAWELK